MASKKTLNAKNLQELGAERLAELLIEISTGNAAAKRRLRLELAGAQSPQEAAREVAKRLTSIARSKTWVDWQKRKALVADLNTQLKAITTLIAPTDPGEAMALLWRFLQLATPIYERCDDSSGEIGAIFQQAVQHLGEIAPAADIDRETLAGSVFDALQQQDFGQYDGLIPILAPSLGAEGLAALKQKVEALAAEQVKVPPESEWRAVGYGSGGAIYAHEIHASGREWMVQRALQAIADASGDVDAFIAQYEPEEQTLPEVAADIAIRLLADGRAEEALTFIENADPDDDFRIPHEWEMARLEVLEALGREEEAQAFRLECFQTRLSDTHLRDYLKRLADFDDVEAEEAAMAHAMDFPVFAAGLWFFTHWPSAIHAARMVRERGAEMDGNDYEILGPAAEILSARHPLEATLVLRAMIDFTLKKGRSSRYGHAARHLAECGGLSAQIADFGDYDSHEAYFAGLKKQHGRKYGFWERVEG